MNYLKGKANSMEESSYVLFKRIWDVLLFSICVSHLVNCNLFGQFGYLL